MKLTVVALASACIFLLSSCSTDLPATRDQEQSASATAYTANDIMFAQMMIPHHQQAVDMSELALEKSSDDAVLALAADIRAAQAPEIDQMTRWLEESGSSVDGGDHAGHMNMGGMLTEEEMERLEQATGAAFDRLFLEGMIVHHEGAIVMARMIADSPNPEVTALGEAITVTQREEIEIMRDLLDR